MSHPLTTIESDFYKDIGGEGAPPTFFPWTGVSTFRRSPDPSPFFFTKLSFQHCRTYLQAPALRRSGGIQSCPTVTGVSLPRPLSLPLARFSFRRWAHWRNPLPPRQAPPNQPHPYPRTAAC